MFTAERGELNGKVVQWLPRACRVGAVEAVEWVRGRCVGGAASFLVLLNKKNKDFIEANAPYSFDLLKASLNCSINTSPYVASLQPRSFSTKHVDATNLSWHKKDGVLQIYPRCCGVPHPGGRVAEYFLLAAQRSVVRPVRHVLGCWEVFEFSYGEVPWVAPPIDKARGAGRGSGRIVRQSPFV